MNDKTSSQLFMPCTRRLIKQSTRGHRVFYSVTIPAVSERYVHLADKNFEYVMDYDFFISHASEDKDAVVRPLAQALTSRGYSVWYDEYCLKVGDSLSSGIDRGLAASKFGIVVLSPAFFQKHWTQRELRGLVALDEQGRSKILPIWHNVTKADVVNASPTLADIIAAHTKDGLEEVVDALSGAVGPKQPVVHERDQAVSTLPTVTNGPIRESGHAVFVPGAYFETGGMDLLAALAEDPELHGWYFGKFQYSSGQLSGSLDEAAKDLSGFMEGQVRRPGEGCALIAHGIGGLVAQQAILNSRLLADRLTLLALLGVPSAGLKPSRFIGFFRRPGVPQVDAGGTWIAAVRAKWAERFGQRSPFKVLAVAAALDAFVPPESSLAPFPFSQQIVVQESHESLITPQPHNEGIVQLLARELKRG